MWQLLKKFSSFPAITFITFISFFSVSANANADSQANRIIGKWKVLDDKTGNPTGIVEIKLDKRTGMFYGVPNKALRKGRSINNKCEVCPGRFKNKPIKSVPVIWNYTYDAKKKKYTGGYALDFLSGKVYNGDIKLTKSGKSLHLRGSPLGAKFIGRTTTWTREKD